MVELMTRCILLTVLVVTTKADDIDGEGQISAMAKLMRAMVNQTKADSLNLPANATSIRENITDTFSCENRTYGYYADVDNDCQLFHVCLPSQTPSGRNVTYKWSFICPSETVFNQEVLVCTRERDSIPCEESPMYYDLNMEIGKEKNDSREQTSGNENNPANYPAASDMNYNNVADNNYNNNNNYNAPANNNNYYNTPSNNNYYNTPANNNKYYNSEAANIKQVERIKNKPQQRNQQTNRKKQNLVVQNLIKEVIQEEMKKGDDEPIEFGEKTIQIPDDTENTGENDDLNKENIKEYVKEVVDVEDIVDNMENSRITSERRKKRERQIARGMFRFKADV